MGVIDESKTRNALEAINAVLVAARAMAWSKRPAEEMADVLDVAEYLPCLLLEPVDRTVEFREQLVFLATQYRAFPFFIALQKFDG